MQIKLSKKKISIFLTAVILILGLGSMALGIWIKHGEPGPGGDLYDMGSPRWEIGSSILKTGAIMFIAGLFTPPHLLRKAINAIAHRIRLAD